LIRIALLAAALAAPVAVAQDAPCVPVGQWVVPGAAAPVPAADVLSRAARQSVVLVGESHDSAEHHRWQLQVVTALHAQRPDMVIALEMFPRRVQPVLDRWTRGELGEAEFLEAAEWRTVWDFDPALYLPIFHFARMNRVPMVAANVDRAAAREVGQKGFDGVTAERREGVGRGAVPPAAYVEMLARVWQEHLPADRRVRKPTLDDADFRRFVDAQVLWDRAMAEAIAAALRRQPQPLVVGIMGRGHVEYGYGVPHQLRDLGVTAVMSMVPWDRGSACAVPAGVADAVYGVAAPAAKVGGPPRPRLGIVLETTPDGVRIQRVEKGSVAEATGLREGDVIVEIAGRPARQNADVASAVQRQAPGTWLPLAVRRGGERVELIAKFAPGD
jgi:uncharacterized iron-regulated protein